MFVCVCVFACIFVFLLVFKGCFLIDLRCVRMLVLC